MSIVSIGDLAQSFLLRRQNAELKQVLEKASAEVVTGRVSDMSSHLHGEFSFVTGIDRSLEMLEVYASAGTEADLFLTVQQTALTAAREAVLPLATGFLSAGNSDIPAVVSGTAETAEVALGQVIEFYNGSVAGQNIFSGVTTDQPPFAAAEDMLAALETATAGLTTAADVAAAVEAWFDTPGGGFETTGYLGSDTPLAGRLIGPGQQVATDTTGLHPRMRAALKGLATAAIATRTTPALAFNEQRDLMTVAGTTLLSAADDLTALQTEISLSQSVIEKQQARISAESTTLQISRNNLLSVDPFEAVTKLEQAETQLEALYSVTSRLSRLTLADFLR